MVYSPAAEIETRTGTKLTTLLEREAERQEDYLEKIEVEAAKAFLSLQKTASASVLQKVEKLISLETQRWNRSGYRDGLLAAVDILEEEY